MNLADLRASTVASSATLRKHGNAEGLPWPSKIEGLGSAALTFCFSIAHTFFMLLGDSMLFADPNLLHLFSISFLF